MRSKATGSKAKRGKREALLLVCAWAFACESGSNRAGRPWLAADLGDAGEGGVGASAGETGGDSGISGQHAAGEAGAVGGNGHEQGGASTASGAGGHPPKSDPCAGAFDTDEDGVCDGDDIDDDDDGFLDAEDRLDSGEDTSRDSTRPLGGKGHAPNAVLNEPCAQEALAEANARLEELGLGAHALVPQRGHSAFDRSGFFTRADGLGRVLTSTDGAAGVLVGAEFHVVRLDGVGENDQYVTYGVDTWDDATLGAEWESPMVFRGTGMKYTAYARGDGSIVLAFGSLNPATGTGFDERILGISQTRDAADKCPWRLLFSPRVAQTARSELTFLCSDYDHEAGIPSAHCAEGRYAETADQILRGKPLPCEPGSDSDGDGLNDCDEDDDDDDGVRDADDLVLGGDSLALDPTQPGDEPSSAPNAILNDPCVVKALREAAFDTHELPRQHETRLHGLFLHPPNPNVPQSGYGFEMEIRPTFADHTTQRGISFTAAGFNSSFVQRNVIGRGDATRYARFKRSVDLATIVVGTVTDNGFAGEFLLVGVPPAPQNPCPVGQGSWFKSTEDYVKVEPAELEYACVEEGVLHNTLRGWYRPDGAYCTCSGNTQVSCTE